MRPSRRSPKRCRRALVLLLPVACAFALTFSTYGWPQPTAHAALALDSTGGERDGNTAVGVSHAAQISPTTDIGDAEQQSFIYLPQRNVVVKEGDSGTTDAIFIVRLTAASDKPITVNYAGADSVGTATAPSDYEETRGTLVFNPGETEKTVRVPIKGDTTPEPEEFFRFNATQSVGLDSPFSLSIFCYIYDDDAAPGIRTPDAHYAARETDGSINIPVVRFGDASAAASANYFVTASNSLQNSFTPALGKIDFAPGETEKSFTVLLDDDAFVEEPEMVNIDVETASGFTITTLTINSDDAQLPTPANNPVNASDIYVRQHYHDFLNREPDDAGWGFWKDQIEACGANAQCREVMRVNVSTAFLLSIEFQRTGFQVFRLYAASSLESTRDRHGLPPWLDFIRDVQALGRGVVVGTGDWEGRLRRNTLDFARDFVRRQEFITQFPEAMTAREFADKLFANSGVTPAQAELDEAVAAFGAGDADGRAAALLSATGSASVYNRQYNTAFVYMQYAGYLRRNPDEPGFNFWLAKLDSFSRPGEDVRDDVTALGRVKRAEMVRAFVESAEYRTRFGQP